MLRQRNEKAFDKHEYLNLWNKLCLLQWPHPADGDRDQSGRGSGAQDPSQIRWPRVCQCKNRYIVLTIEQVQCVLPEHTYYMHMLKMYTN